MQDMLKTCLVALTMTTACATSDKPTTSEKPTAPVAPTAPGEAVVSAEIKSATADGLDFAASSDGTRIAFERAGKGPALVIVGGALSDRKGGKPLVGKLMDRFTVYIYDRRGRGQSGDMKPYSVEREIEDLGAVVEKAGNQAYVYGVSSGAALALQAAPKLGSAKVQRLALYEPPYGQAEGDFNAQKKRIGQLVQTGKPGEAAAFFFAAIGTPPEALEGMKRSPEWAGMSKIDFTLAYDYAVLGNGAVPADTVRAITVPTLVMHGEKSMAFMRSTADRIADLAPKAQRKTIQGQGHQAAPEAVAPLLIEFFGTRS